MKDCRLMARCSVDACVLGTAISMNHDVVTLEHFLDLYCLSVRVVLIL